jgi:2-oxoglutarate/2-oxoacid ferredoxin oxidoreductase subunit beta
MTENICKLTRADLKIDGPVKWCTGCGGYPILSAVQKALPETGVSHENIVFVSGIGCSSRFPYYINTYGFHSLHGRAMAIASGMKAARPELNIWIATGDGDSMAIGGNHFIHMIRRNIDINCIIFNNRIYGLTKGQYSPTTPMGLKTKTSPDGTIERPFEAGELTMGSQGTFFARVIDAEPKGMEEVFISAAKHKGTSVIEVFQNCLIFNDATHDIITAKDVREDRIIYLRHGKKMIFGKEKNKGLVLEGMDIKAVTIGENGYTLDDILVHDVTTSNPNMHYMLARMNYPELPVAIGVIRAVEQPTYDALLQEQVDNAVANTKIKNMKDLLVSGKVFEL